MTAEQLENADVVHISSLVVHMRPDVMADVTDYLDQKPGLEIQGGNEQGKMVVTLETLTEHAVLDAISEINYLPGVLSTSLVFHQIDDAREEQTALTPANVGVEAL
ncbi:chaperone NapD [Corallincola platygyrae]|uniref:Chaperone NapD n=1 Tax=Corallincola platygyrae TaxID=1193278 RepID=A0ABW4XQF1_9GAMM